MSHQTYHPLKQPVFDLTQTTPVTGSEHVVRRLIENGISYHKTGHVYSSSAPTLYLLHHFCHQLRGGGHVAALNPQMRWIAICQDKEVLC